MNDDTTTLPPASEQPADTAPQPVAGGSYQRHPDTHELIRVSTPEPPSSGDGPAQHIPTAPGRPGSV